MPYFNGMGPLGEGPMTGWGLGPCGYGGYGMLAGRGRGLGRGRRFWSRGWTKKDEQADLESYKKDLEDELSAIKADLAELEKTK
ncbi:DUF5320 domain-containing protein [Patescibacteria group bacterium]|nr:DUF5320 domain-containing protein [Patescibacteria group bacterium]MBU1970731.1 DUF5320 domain-containing protein [Patescibacteria group bacterium]